MRIIKSESIQGPKERMRPKGEPAQGPLTEIMSSDAHE